MTARLTTPRSVLNVREFGATGGGTTDDSAAIQAAIDSRGTGGGTVLFPPGTYYIRDAVLLLPQDNEAMLTLSGYGATFKFEAQELLTCIALASPAVVTVPSPHFGHYTIEGFAIDCQNQHYPPAAGLGGVIGLQPFYKSYWETPGQNAIIDDIHIRDIHIYNVLTEHDGGNYYEKGISIAVAAVDDTQDCSIKNVWIERCRIEGCHTGFTVTGYSPPVPAPSIYEFDNINIIDCSHDTGIIETSTVFACNYQIGSQMSGGSVVLRGCYGRGSGDTGIEVDQPTNCLIENCLIEDSHGCNLVFVNFQPPLVPDAQRIVVRNCDARVTQSASADSHGFGIWHSTGGETPFGEVIFENCSFYRMTNMTGGAPGAKGFSIDAPVKGSVVFQNCRSHIEGFTTDVSFVQSAFHTIMDGGETYRPLIVFSNCSARFTGTRTGANIYALGGFLLEGSGRFVLDNCEVSVDVTKSAGGNTYGVWNEPVSTTGSFQSGVVRGLRLTVADDDAGTLGVHFAGQADVTLDAFGFLVAECDFSAAGASATEVSDDYGAAMIRVRENIPAP